MRLHTSSILSEKLTRSLHCSRFFEPPFSEQEIIELNDVFLTHGIHDITVSDIAAGRTLIDTFLSSLNYYNNVACLTASDIPLRSSIFDIYSEVAGGDLEEFFLEQFYFDFLWIEVSPTLTETAWFLNFELKLLSFNMDQLLPVIILSYEE